MCIYLIPVSAIILILAALYILFFAAVRDIGDARVDIIINADGECAEQQVITAKRVASRYFKNSAVYVRGGNKTYAEALCRAYGAELIGENTQT